MCNYWQYWSLEIPLVTAWLLFLDHRSLTGELHYSISLAMGGGLGTLFFLGGAFPGLGSAYFLQHVNPFNKLCLQYWFSLIHLIMDRSAEVSLISVALSTLWSYVQGLHCILYDFALCMAMK